MYYTRPAEAEQFLREVLTANPNLHGMRPFLAMCLSRQGKHEAALAELTDSVIRNAAVDPDIAYAVASVYALEGVPIRPSSWLQRSVALGNGNKPCFVGDPNLKNVRADPRFAELMAKIAR